MAPEAAKEVKNTTASGNKTIAAPANNNKVLSHPTICLHRCDGRSVGGRGVARLGAWFSLTTRSVSRCDLVLLYVHSYGKYDHWMSFFTHPRCKVLKSIEAEF